jgi:nucleoside-diphosphate-sugar epimerase
MLPSPIFVAHRRLKEQTRQVVNHQISILGCGWLGSALARHLAAQGYRVYGSTRSQPPSRALPGITHFVIDTHASGEDYAAFLESDVLVIAIPSKEVAAFQRLVSQIEASSLRKVIFISSTSVYPLTNGIVTEETALKSSPLAEIEQLFIGSPVIDATILRFGGLFGYDRQPGHFFRPGRTIASPEGYVNMIHQDDCIRIIEAIIRQDRWGQVLNACADDHPTRRAFYTQEAAKVGRTDLSFEEASENQYKIVSSEKLKRCLGYEFVYANLVDDG